MPILVAVNCCGKKKKFNGHGISAVPKCNLSEHFAIRAGCIYIIVPVCKLTITLLGHYECLPTIVVKKVQRRLALSFQK